MTVEGLATRTVVSSTASGMTMEVFRGASRIGFWHDAADGRSDTVSLDQDADGITEKIEQRVLQEGCWLEAMDSDTDADGGMDTELQVRYCNGILEEWIVRLVDGATEGYSSMEIPPVPRSYQGGGTGISTHFCGNNEDRIKDDCAKAYNLVESCLAKTSPAVAAIGAARAAARGASFICVPTQIGGNNASSLGTTGTYLVFRSYFASGHDGVETWIHELEHMGGDEGTPPHTGFDEQDHDDRVTSCSIFCSCSAETSPVVSNRACIFCLNPIDKRVCGSKVSLHASTNCADANDSRSEVEECTLAWAHCQTCCEGGGLPPPVADASRCVTAFERWYCDETKDAGFAESYLCTLECPDQPDLSLNYSWAYQPSPNCANLQEPHANAAAVPEVQTHWVDSSGRSIGGTIWQRDSCGSEYACRSRR